MRIEDDEEDEPFFFFLDDDLKVLRRKVALEIHRLKLFLYAYPVELINADPTSQRSMIIAGLKKGSVAWGAGV